MNKKIKVLSLFDGISVAQQALKELGYDVEYYASEIDKYAIQITQKNHPSTIQVGSVTDIVASEYCLGNKNNQTILTFGATNGIEMEKEKIDLLIGGSPCQDLSIAKKNREGLKGSRSSLFWEYVRILKEVKPKYFVLENVASMSEESRNIISEALGVKPILFDANLVSAQNRKRLFWTSIPHITLPEPKCIKLSDIMEFGVDDRYFEIPKNTVRKNEKKWQWDTSGKGYQSQQDRATHISQQSTTLPSSRTEDKCKIFYGETVRKLTPHRMRTSTITTR